MIAYHDGRIVDTLSQAGTGRKGKGEGPGYGGM
jgi:hypothetical protein